MRAFSIGLLASYCTQLKGINESEEEAGRKKKLRFGKNGKFKIVQLTDMHMGINEEKDIKTQKMIANIIDLEKPQLVMVTGDIISGNKWDKKTLPWASVQYNKLTAVLTEKK